MSNQNKVSDATEPYGAQVLRRLHEDQSLLMADYDAMNENLDPNDPQQAGVKALLTKKLVTMEKNLTSIEKSFQQKYKELEPIEDSLPVEENKEETNVDEPIIVEHVELGPCVVVDANEDGSAIVVEDEQGQQHEVALTVHETKSLFGGKSWASAGRGAAVGATFGGLPGALAGAYIGAEPKTRTHVNRAVVGSGGSGDNAYGTRHAYHAATGGGEDLIEYEDKHGTYDRHKKTTAGKSMRRGALIGAGLGTMYAGAPVMGGVVGAGIGHLLEQRARRREAQALVALANEKGLGEDVWKGTSDGMTAGTLYGTAVGGATGAGVGALAGGVGAIPGGLGGAGLGATLGAGVGAVGGAIHGAGRHFTGKGKKEKKFGYNASTGAKVGLMYGGLPGAALGAAPGGITGAMLRKPEQEGKGWHKDSDSFCPDCESEPCVCEGPGEYGEKRQPTYMSPLFSMGDLNVTAGNAGVVGTGMQVPKMDFGFGSEDETKKYLARKRYKSILKQTSKFLSDISQAKDLEEEDRMKCYHMHAILSKGLLRKAGHYSAAASGATTGAGMGAIAGGGAGTALGAVAGGVGSALLGGDAATGAAIGGLAGQAIGGTAGTIGGAYAGGKLGGSLIDAESKKDKKSFTKPGGFGEAIGGTAGQWIGGRIGAAGGALADTTVIPLIFKTSKFLKSLAFEKAFGLPHRETAKALQEEVDQEIAQVEQEENQEERTEEQQLENGEEGQEQYIPEEYNTPEGFDDEANPPDSMNEAESGIYEPTPEEAVEGTFGEYGEEMGERGEKGAGNALHGFVVKPSEDIGAGVYDVATGNVTQGAGKIARGVTYGPYADAYQGAVNTGYYSPNNRQNQESNLHGVSTLGTGVTGSVVGGTLGAIAGSAVGGPIGAGVGGYTGSALGALAGAGIGHAMTRKKQSEKSLFGVYTRVKNQGWVLAKSFQSPKVAVSYAKHLNAMGKAVHVDRVQVKGYGRSIVRDALAGGLIAGGLSGAAVGARYGAERGIIAGLIGSGLGTTFGAAHGAIRQYRQNRAAKQKAMMSMGDDSAYKTDAMGFRVHRDQVDAKTKIGKVLQGVKEVIQAVGGSAEVRAHGLDIKFRISWDVIGDVMGKLVAMFGKAVSRRENEITVDASQVEDTTPAPKKRSGSKRDPYASEDGPDYGENPSRKGKSFKKGYGRSIVRDALAGGLIAGGLSGAAVGGKYGTDRGITAGLIGGGLGAIAGGVGGAIRQYRQNRAAQKALEEENDPGFVGDLNWIKEEQQELEHGGQDIQDVLQSQGQQIEELSKALVALQSQLS